MKYSQRLLIDRFPNIEKQTNPLNDREKLFFELYEFLSAPEENSYDLQVIMGQTEAENVHFFLKVLYTYFEKDTSLPLQLAEPMDIRENQNRVDYLSQTDLSHYLIREGHTSWKPNKVTTYYGRGKLPEPDLQLSGKPYWSKETASLFSNQLKKL